MPLITITAWEGLVDRAKVHAGQTVLGHAGAGGVGHIAIQVTRAYGATVFATVSPEKRSIAESFGATPIDYRSIPIEEYVFANADGKGFRHCLRHRRRRTLDTSFVAVKRYTGTSSAAWDGDRTLSLRFHFAEPPTPACLLCFP